MQNTDFYRVFIGELEGWLESIEETIQSSEEQRAVAVKAFDKEAESVARGKIKECRGRAELVSALRNSAAEALNVRGMSFDQLIVVMEGSYLHLQGLWEEQGIRQEAAFREALLGGNRATYERETDELNAAQGRFDEIRRWLNRARALAES